MKDSSKQPAKTMLAISLGFMLLYLVWKWEWTLYVAAAVSLIGVMSPFLSRQIDFVWMKLAWLLSKIIPNILLAIVFYVVLFPISILTRSGKNKSPLKLKNNSDSLYVEHNKEFDRASFEKPW